MKPLMRIKRRWSKIKKPGLEVDAGSEYWVISTYRFLMAAEHIRFKLLSTSWKKTIQHY